MKASSQNAGQPWDDMLAEGSANGSVMSRINVYGLGIGMLNVGPFEAIFVSGVGIARTGLLGQRRRQLVRW